MSAVAWLVFLAPLVFGGPPGWMAIGSPRVAVALDVAFLLVFSVLMVVNMLTGDPLMTALAGCGAGCYVYSLRFDLRALRASRERA